MSTNINKVVNNFVKDVRKDRVAELDNPDFESTSQMKHDNAMQYTAEDISDTLDDIAYDIKHNDDKGLSEDLDKLDNLDYGDFGNDYTVPDDVSLNVHILELIDDLADRKESKIFNPAVRTLNKYREISSKEFNAVKEVDSSLFLDFE